jgi:hypothetical protein
MSLVLAASNLLQIACLCSSDLQTKGNLTITYLVIHVIRYPFFRFVFLHHVASFSGSVKYLGVILDFGLIWREHMDVKMRKAHNLLCACRRACGVKWGLRSTVVYWLYVAIIRPSISFASLVRRSGCQTASAKKRLSRVQRLACLWIK